MFVKPKRYLIYLIMKGDFVEKAAMACFIMNRIKKEALLYIIMGKNWPLCFFSQGVDLLFCFKNMIKKFLFCVPRYPVEKSDERKELLCVVMCLSKLHYLNV